MFADEALATVHESIPYQKILKPMIEDMINDQTGKLEVCPLEEVGEVRAVKSALQSILTTIENGYKRTIANEQNADK